jgi:hypothetical protein
MRREKGCVCGGGGRGGGRTKLERNFFGNCDWKKMEAVPEEMQQCNAVTGSVGCGQSQQLCWVTRRNLTWTYNQRKELLSAPVKYCTERHGGNRPGSLEFFLLFFDRQTICPALFFQISTHGHHDYLDTRDLEEMYLVFVPPNKTGAGPGLPNF